MAGGQEAAKVKFVLQAWSFQILLLPQISGFKENQGGGSIYKCIKTNGKRALPVNEGKGPRGGVVLYPRLTKFSPPTPLYFWAYH